MTNIATETPQPSANGLDPTIVLGRFEGFSTTVLTILGDRLGLFRALAASPATATELAQRCSLQERYLQEWLYGMLAAGYLTASGDGCYQLVAGADTLLATDDTPMSMGGAFQFLGALVRVIDEVEFAFRHGGGVPQDHYGRDCSRGIGRMNAPNYDHFLVPVWIPAAGLADRLETGVSVAEIGCGQGRALLRLAEAYPKSSYIGYDIFPAAVEDAQQAVPAEWPNVRYEVRDATRGLPDRFDVILAFDVVHDAVDPRGLLRSVRAALQPGGMALVTEPEFEADGYPLAVTNYAISLLYCMTTSLARGGAGLGTCGLPDSAFSELAKEAGFASVQRVPAGTPLQRLFILNA